MAGFSSAQFASYAREQIRTADIILVDHVAKGPMCCCGRVTPCSVAVSVTRRRAHFVEALARLVARPVVGRVRNMGTATPYR